MSTENIPSVEETNRQLNRGLLREMRKPVLAAAVAAASFLMGNHIDGTHQAHADELQAEFEAGYDALPPAEQIVVDAHWSGDELPEGTDPEVIDEADRLEALNEEQQLEESAGDPWTLPGKLAILYAGVKVAQIGASKLLSRDMIKRRHPDLAPDRVKDNASILVNEGGWVEEEAKRDEKYGWGLLGSDAVYLEEKLREIGSDIEAAESFTYDREGLSETLIGMLNSAQSEAMINQVYDEEQMSKLSDPEALQIRIINDLWTPTETFKSVKDWYTYRRKQVMEPYAFHNISEPELFLPELKETKGGIGIAVGRIAQYWRTYTDNRRDNNDAAVDAMVFATEGAELLDKVVPRQDGTHWIDYIDALTKGVDLSKMY